MPLETQDQLKQIYNDYMLLFPEENPRQVKFKEFIWTTESSMLYTRKNFVGHLTASCFILDKVSKMILLLHHKSLNKWLQPGGHIDETDNNILAAAYRECAEETGITKTDLNLFQPNGILNLPFDLDSHLIPKNDKKNEETHYHHDVRYLFFYDGAEDIKIDLTESKGFVWKSFDDLRENQEFGKLIQKFERFT